MVRILIVGDEPALRLALAINLRARHYDVEAVGDGTSALHAASSHPPDLVIVDLGLPDIDGVDVIAGLRGWANMPVIVLSARDHQSLGRRTGRRCRRLRHETLRDGRTAGTDPRRATTRGYRSDPRRPGGAH